MLKTRLIVIAHRRELYSTSNTGRLACLALPNSEMRVRGDEGTPVSDEGIQDRMQQPLLLYPSEDSTELCPNYLDQLRTANSGLPFTLIVPDGTWRQAFKVAKREPGVSGIPRVRLPRGAQSTYRMRQAPSENMLCTYEAIARAMGIIENPGVQTAMETAFAVVMERALWTRGKLRLRDCVHPIPEAAISGPNRVRG